jgi:putative addiction module component (TIGR02574 family)
MEGVLFAKVYTPHAAQVFQTLLSEPQLSGGCQTPIVEAPRGSLGKHTLRFPACGRHSGREIQESANAVNEKNLQRQPARPSNSDHTGSNQRHHRGKKRNEKKQVENGHGQSPAELMLCNIKYIAPVWQPPRLAGCMLSTFPVSHSWNVESGILFRMTQEATELLKKALALSTEERVQLVDSLLESLDAPHEAASVVEAAWNEEIARRIVDLDSGKAKAVSLEEFRRKLKSASE